MIYYVLWLSVKSPHTSVCPFCLFTFEIGQRSEASHLLGSDFMVYCISSNSAVLAFDSGGGLGRVWSEHVCLHNTKETKFQKLKMLNSLL